MAVTARPEASPPTPPSDRRRPLGRLVARLADALGTAEARAYGAEHPRPPGS